MLIKNYKRLAFKKNRTIDNIHPGDENVFIVIIMLKIIHSNVNIAFFPKIIFGKITYFQNRLLSSYRLQITKEETFYRRA